MSKSSHDMDYRNEFFKFNTPSCVHRIGNIKSLEWLRKRGMILFYRLLATDPF